MAKTVDSRVVEMKFNNKQFETEAKKSISTIEKLKAAISKLTISNKTFGNFGAAVKTSKSSLDSIADSVAALEKRFSFMGETARRVLNNITSTLTGTLMRGINYVTDGIVSGGLKRATNLENAHFQLQALLKDEKLVQEVMDNANAAVDGTAYSFDEAAKAAAMFKASGIEAGEPMTNALKGIVGTAAMTNAEFERISMIFTAVAGQGRIMGDQLLQLSSLGLNAPATIAKYFNEIDDASTKASDKVRAAVKEITKGKEVTEKDIRQLVTDGEISFEIFAEAMYSAFGDSAEKANETFTGAMSNIRSALARIGAGFISPLIEQNSSVIKLVNRVREKINEVKSALVFDKEAGNVEAYSKRFTDALLGMAKATAKFVKNLDVESGMKVFYNVVDSLINVFKALGSVIAPIGRAFAEVFLDFNVGDVIDVTDALKKFTEGLKLSEGASKAVQSVFKGLFSVIKLVAGGFISVLGAILPVGNPLKALGDVILTVAGAFGEALTGISKWIQTSPAVQRAYQGLTSVVKAAMKGLESFVLTISKFIKKAIEMGAVEKIIGLVIEGFRRLGEFAAPYLEKIGDAIGNFINKVKEVAPAFAKAAFDKIVEVFKNFKEAVSNFNISDAIDGLKNLYKGFENFMGSIDRSSGIFAFVENMKSFGEKLKTAFDFSPVVSNLEKFKNLVKGFTDWFSKTIGPFFEGFSLGGVAATAGGLGIVYAVVNISNALKDAVSKLDKLPEVLGNLAGAIKSYQDNMKADTLKKVAIAILALAAALAVLSFTDTDKALQASLALSVISGVLLKGTESLIKVLNKGRSIDNVALQFSRGLSKAMKNLSKAVKIKAIGSAFKDFGKAILMIAGSLIAIGLMYKNDKESLKAAEEAVAVIAIVMTGIMSAMTILNNKMGGGGSDFMKSAIGILALTMAVAKIISAFQKVLKIDLPNDWGVKMGILISLLGGVAALALALGAAGKIAGSGTLKSGPILSLAVVLLACTSAMKQVLKIDLPEDMGLRMTMLAEMFLGLGGVLIALGYASKLSGGAIKAAPTLLALAVDIAAIALSLMILSIIPGDQLLKGATALGGVLTALALGIAAAGKIADEKPAKTVLAMAITVGAITAALGVLSMVSWEALLPAAVSLGGVLLTVATGLLAASKITNENVWKPITVMIGVVITIAGSLYILSQQPWEGMLAAATAMSATLLAFSAAFVIVSKAEGMDLAKAGTFLAFTLAVVPIGVALYALSNQPWQGMLAAGTVMSAVFLAMSAAFLVISKSNPNLTAVAGFVACSLALIPMSAALHMLAGESWSSITPGAVALAGVMTAMSAALVIASKGGTNLAGVLGFVAASVALIPIASVITQLSGLSWEEVATGLVALAGGLAVIGVAGLAGVAIAPGLLALSVSMIAFAGGMAAVGAALPIFVNGLTVAVQALSQFIADIGAALPKMVDAGKNLMIGLAQGIVSGVTAVIDTAKSVASGIVDTVKNFLGIHSPSTIFEAIGINVDEGFANGILGGAGNVDGAIGDVFGNLSERVDVSSLFGTGEDATSIFGDGLLSGEGNVDSIMQNLADSTGIDLSSFTSLGEGATDNFGSGLLSGDGDIQSILEDLTSTSGIDLESFNIMGEDAASLFGSGLSSNAEETKTAVKKMTDVSGVDVKSYNKLGKDASSSFIKGFKSGSKEAVNEAAQSLAKSLSSAISSAVKGTNFKAPGKEVISQFSSAVNSSKQNATSAMKNVMTAVANAIKSESNQFKSKGASSMEAFVKGITSKKGDVTNAIKAITKAITKYLHESEKEFQNQGKNLAETFVKSFDKKKDSAVTTVKEFVSKMVKAIDGRKTDFTSSGKKSAEAFLSSLKSALSSGSSKIISQMTTLGKQIVQGITKGINSNSSLATNAARKLADSIDQAVKTKLEIHSPSKVGELRGKQWDEGIGQGILKSRDVPIDAAKSIADGINNTMVDGVKKVKETMSQNMLDFVAPTAQQSAIKQVQDYWEKLLEVKKQGAEAERYQDMELLEFKQDILARQREILAEYDEQMKSAKESALDQISLFSEVSESMLRTRQQQIEAEKAQEAAYEKMSDAQKKQYDNAAKNAKSMNTMLKEQNKAYQKYIDVMTSLSKKLKGTELLDSIKELGIDSLPYLIELNEMTGKQLDRYVDQYDEKIDLAAKVAGIKMSEVTKQTEKQINDLYNLNEKGKNKNKKQKDAIVEDERTYWEKLLEVKRAGAEAEKYQEMSMQEFRDSMLQQTQEIMQNYQSQFEQVRENFVNQIDLFSQISQKTAVTFDEISANLTANVNAIKEYADTMNSLKGKVQSENLWEYLNELGVDSLDQLKVFNTMSADQLKMIESQYDEGVLAAGQAAQTRLGDIQKDTEEKLQDLFGTVGEIDLTEFTEKFDGTIDSVEKFIEDLQTPIEEGVETLEKGAQGLVDAMSKGLDSGMASANAQVGPLAAAFVAAVAGGIQEGTVEVQTASESIVDSAVEPIQNGGEQFHEAGATCAKSYTTAIQEEVPQANSAGEEVATSTVGGMAEKEPAFQAEGNKEGSLYATGINDQQSTAYSAGSNIANSAASGMSAAESQFYAAGQYAGSGYVSGLQSMLDAAKQVAAEFASITVEKTEEELEIESPSKRMAQVGRFAGMGFIVGLMSQIASAGVAAKDLGAEAVNGAEEGFGSLSEVISDDMFKDPVIKPEVDLSDVTRSVDDISKMFNQAIALATAAALDVNEVTVNAKKAQTSNENGRFEDDQNKSSKGNTFNLIQNNYSPKALSRIDIYRQTNNQFSLLRTAVTNS